MTNQITTHTFPVTSQTVRTIEIEGDPWFVAADVCKALKLKNTSVVVSRLDAEEKSKFFLGFGSDAYCVSESGLYKLIMRAHPNKNPYVKKFQDWVTKDVLPAIRKDGAYIMGEEKVVSGEMDEDEFVLKAINILQNKVERLKAEKAQAVAERNVALDTITTYNHQLLKWAKTVRGLNVMKLQSDLVRLKYLKKDKTPYAKYEKFFVSRMASNGFMVNVVTDQGKELIIQLFAMGQLTKKKG